MGFYPIEQMLAGTILNHLKPASVKLFRRTNPRKVWSQKRMLLITSSSCLPYVQPRIIKSVYFTLAGTNAQYYLRSFIK